jgi:hypothetical protein
MLKSTYFVTTGLVMILTLAGCAKLEKIGKSNEEIVAERAEARWRALIDGNLEKAYGYLTPGYRKVTSYDRYRRGVRGVGVWRDVKVESVTCETELCQVDVRIFARFTHPRMNKPLDTQEVIREGWLFDQEADDWFFVTK